MITTLFHKNAKTAYMSWEALTLDELRGFFHTYEVIYYETTQTICGNIESEFSDTLPVETNSTSVIIRDLDPVAEYCVGVAASTVAGVGNYSQKHLPCKNYSKQACVCFWLMSLRTLCSSHSTLKCPFSSIFSWSS